MKKITALLLAILLFTTGFIALADESTPSEAVTAAPTLPPEVESTPNPATPGEATRTPRVKPRPTPTAVPEEEEEEEPLYAFAQEDITIPADGYTIPATVTVPTGYAGKTFPCVILCASYGRGRNEAGNAYNTLAARLAEHGIASIRFDYKGIGDSEEDFSTFTFFDGMEEAMLCYEYMTAREDINPLAMGILGWGMGGGIALETAGEYEMFDSLAVWSVADYNGTLTSEEEQAYNASQDHGVYEAALDWGDTLRLAPQYFESMLALDTQAALEKIPAPILLVEGEDDAQRVSRTREMSAAAQNGNTTLEILPNTDASYGAQENEETFDALCSLTVDWFKETL